MESMFGISAQTPSPLFRMEVASQSSTSWRSQCEHRRSNQTESFSAVGFKID